MAWWQLRKRTKYPFRKLIFSRWERKLAHDIGIWRSTGICRDSVWYRWLVSRDGVSPIHLIIWWAMRRRTGAALPSPGPASPAPAPYRRVRAGPQPVGQSYLTCFTMKSCFLFLYVLCKGRSAASSWPACLISRPIQISLFSLATPVIYSHLGEMCTLWCCVFGHQRAALRFFVFTLSSE